MSVLRSKSHDMAVADPEKLVSMSSFLVICVHADRLPISTVAVDDYLYYHFHRLFRLWTSRFFYYTTTGPLLPRCPGFISLLLTQARCYYYHFHYSDSSPSSSTRSKIPLRYYQGLLLFFSPSPRSITIRYILWEETFWKPSLCIICMPRALPGTTSNLPTLP